jgi:hypothetical protein
VKRLFFELAGIPFEVNARHSHPPLLLPPDYNPFLRTVAFPHPTTRIQVVDADIPLPPIIGSNYLWACDIWRLGNNKHQRWSIEIHTVSKNEWLPVADCSRNFGRIKIKLRSGRQGLPTSYALHYPADQAIIANRLIQHDALIIHAAGVVWEGQGLIFGGRSGIGKTTLARLWRKQGGVLLNDDRVILRLIDGRPHLFASPWHGEEERVFDQSAPLAGIFHLSQAPTHQCTRLNGAAAVANLMATAVAPFYSAPGIARMLKLAERITQAAPSQRLAFHPNDGIVPFCLARLPGKDPAPEL